HAPVGLPWTAFLAAPVLVVLLTGSASAWRAAGTAWLFGFGYLLWSLHWVGHAFVVDAATYAWLLPFAVTLLPAGLALFWALAGALAWLAGRRRPLATALALAAALTLSEYARSTVLTGFPWALPGYLWIETPLAQLSAWVGPHGLTLATLLVTLLPGTALASGATRPRLAIATAALAGFAALWLAGAQRLATPPPVPADAVVLRVVQPNAPQHLKWDRDWAPRFYARQLDLSAAPADPALGPPDLVIWPETAVAFLPAEQPEARARMAAAAGAPLVLGALDRATAEEGGGFVNGLLVLDRAGAVAARYAKAHLVPFGEYLPLRGVFETLGLRAIAARGRFSPGPGPASVAVPGLPSFAALICYEAIFPGDVAAAVADARRHGAPRPRLLMQVTNDAWFGTLGGPQQHLAQARLRAIEQGLPLVRAANTGISAVIDARGRVLDSLPLGRHGKLDARLPGRIAAPLYANLGDPGAILTAGVLFFASFLRIKKPGFGGGPFVQGS
ncbi:MAG: apolipoprotein N-acyltransferase, partial [Pseudomonadota bacterium]